MICQKVLIIGKRDDPHIEDVGRWINKLGHECVVFDPLSSTDSMQILLEPDPGSEPKNYGFIKVPNQRTYKFAEFTSVWMRFKCYSPMEWEKKIDKLKFDFRACEWLDTLKSLELYLPHCKWLNPINPLVHQKPWQLFIAKAVGFRIPKTAISNDSESILSFFDGESEIVFKTMNPCSVTNDDMTFTNLCDREEISENAGPIKLCPGIFQKFHDKAYELRVTAIGDKFLVCKILSRKYTDTRVDWRRGLERHDLYEVGDIEQAIKEKIIEFQKRARTFYGAFDFIVDEEDKEPIFLECNPGGQWLWIEHIVPSLQISKAVAEYLVS